MRKDAGPLVREYMTQPRSSTTFYAISLRYVYVFPKDPHACMHDAKACRTTCYLQKSSSSRSKKTNRIPALPRAAAEDRGKSIGNLPSIVLGKRSSAPVGNSLPRVVLPGKTVFAHFRVQCGTTYLQHGQCSVPAVDTPARPAKRGENAALFSLLHGTD